MRLAENNSHGEDMKLNIIAFKLHDLDFCLETKSIREIRAWGRFRIRRAKCSVFWTSGARIPIVDLAVKLGMAPIRSSETSAIIVAKVGGYVVGLLVDGGFLTSCR